MLDILIRNGQVVDGSGSLRYPADVAVQGDRIVEVGRLEGATAATTIDAAGCVVTPGFVDMHSHTDFSLPLLPTADSLVHQGITTAVIGQCGASPAPLLAETREEVLAAWESEDMPLPWEEWNTFGSYLDYLRRTGISLNVVPLVGQGTVRAAVMGFGAEPADGEQMARMQAEVVQAMDEGAIGVSTGLIYPPGSYASTEELVDFTHPSGERDGFYFSHIRGEAETLLDAVSEAISIGRQTDTSVQIAHFKSVREPNWHKTAAALELLDAARAEGLDISADLYPYLASNTSLSTFLPDWAHEGGKAAILERLAEPGTRQEMARDMRSGGFAFETDWSQVIIGSAPKNRTYDGRTVDELAGETNKGAVEWVFDALLETGLDIDMISFGMSEDNRKLELRHPAMMIGTDGSARATEGPMSRGKPHPRNYGTFPRVLGYYVREQGTISLEEAIWKMCGLPAEKLRWTDRGLVKAGHRADLVVLDPETVADRATFQDPHQYPVGIHHVLVNGQPVIQGGAHTQALPGSVLGR